MTIIALVLIATPVVILAYAYVVYPLLVAGLSAFRRPRRLGDAAYPDTWPSITITVPCHNEAASIRGTLEQLLALDYPPDRRQILVISDASTDGTDEIVRSFAHRGVELLRLPVRVGKTAAENAAGRMARGEIIVNTDATVRLLPHSLKALVRAFRDPTVGAASGRDVSVGESSVDATGGESRYVSYEMWVRGLETRVGSIVGASGCFYGFRASIHDTRFPDALSRDFACALIAREHGLRAVSVEDALCLVPRTESLGVEYRRKIRTMARGLETLWYKRHLLNARRHGVFAFMLFSHKLARWLFYPALPLAVLGLLLLGIEHSTALLVLGLAGAGALAGVVGIRWPSGRPVPAIFSVPGFVVATSAAGLIAWARLLRGQRNVMWEPTRRPRDVAPPLTSPRA